MFEKKSYVVDTNVLIHCPSCIKKLSYDDNNEVIIPYTVMCELDKLKKEIRISHVVYEVINELSTYRNKLRFLPQFKIDKNASLDENIITEIKNNNLKDIIILTNDILFDIAADKIHELKSEELRDANPFKSESEKITGIINIYDETTGEKIDLRKFPNTFYFEEGKPFFYDGTDGVSKLMNFDHDVWKVKPRNIYQNFAFELLGNQNINVLTINSAAGLGKNYITLASGLLNVLELKKYKKLILIKPLVEIGTSIGFLPGNVDEKIAPYYEYIESLIIKLHELRPANKLFRNQADKDNKIDYANLEFNPRKFQILPATFLRGANIEDAFVIVDEAQNFARDEMRAILTRLGENCKCVILGDTNQVDNRFLNSDNNGLNWVVKKFFGHKNYAHLCLKGDKSRGPICDLVLKSGL